ncbi:nuclear speckle splicing regulatory protein 1-like [Dendronephthya gigantea]|uniref:nuclear speckle splicing regulatory protein 1-like n=1 Tax=Dendronephthya gigantea TaxID=151771 RepID=UPI00106B4510|nr:nuclear speckle splicing regulatory protein 1-like [Dendronephthya gigantea]
MAGKSEKKYGLIIKKKPTSVQVKPSIFGGDDSDEDQSSGRKTVNIKIRKEAEKKKQMRQTELEINKVLEDDPTAYDYDAVYDKMAERKANILAAKSAKVDRKPKYINNLLKFAEVRKKEDERRIERQVQKEREAEGDEFADKDAFVTSAYRQRMQELAEEEERLRKQEERDGDVTKQADLTKFYRNLLDRNVSTGGSYDTEQHAESHDDNTKKSRRSPSPEEERDKRSKRPERERNESRIERDRAREKTREYETRSDRHEERNHEKLKHEEREKEEQKHEERERGAQEHEAQEHEAREHDEEQQENAEHESAKRSGEKHETKKRLKEDTNADENVETETKMSESNLAAGDKGTKDAINKFAKHSSSETVMSARDRYLARKKNRVVVVNTESDDEN